MAGLWVVGARTSGAVAQMEDHPMANSHPDESFWHDGAQQARAPIACEEDKRKSKGAETTNAQGAHRRTKPVTGKQTKQQTWLDLLSRKESVRRP
jgi:hypothetical protein